MAVPAGAAGLVGLVEARDAAHKTTIIADGRQVFLPLRPVDPRSLMQGDFMRLGYERALVDALPKTGGRAFLRLDGDGVARSARPASDSFLFQEGTGKDWGRAKFAIVRIADGDLVLTCLADAARMPIRPQAQSLPLR